MGWGLGGRGVRVLVGEMESGWTSEMEPTMVGMVSSEGMLRSWWSGCGQGG
jgi:hypothetical protein